MSTLLGILSPTFINLGPLFGGRGYFDQCRPRARSLAGVAQSSRRYFQETALVFFQNEAGQSAGSIGGSVNSDSIGTNLWGD